MANSKKTKTKENIKRRKTDVSIFTLLVIAGLIALVVLLCNLVKWGVQAIKYKEYTDKMYYYGYNELYSNNKATAFQKVTNIDMLRVVLGAINNTTDIRTFTIEKSEDEEKLWYQVAKDFNLATRIEEKKINKKATTIDAVIVILKTIEKSLGVTIDESKLEMSEKALEDFSELDRKYIAKAVNLGIIENKDSSLKNSKIIKGELNKLVIELANKYAIMHYNTVSYDENGFATKNDVYIVSDKEKLPKNYKEYPYVISNIDKSVYEMEFRVENEKTFKTPEEVYTTMGKLYGQIGNRISAYYNTLFNVDYNNITTYDFLKNINAHTTYELEYDEINEYVKYVKENKIILKGTAEPLLPIIYDTGENYVVRTKITFEVVNSNTNEDLLFGDKGNNIKYNGKEITMIIDLPMGMTLNSNSLRVNVDCNALHIIGKNNNVLIGEESK